MKRALLIGLAVFFVVLVIVGIYLAGSPREARAKRFDEVRVQDLNAISNAVNNYYDRNEKMPETITQLDEYNQKAFNQTLNLNDPQSAAPYEYRVVSTTTREFELCAQFNLESRTDKRAYNPYGTNSIWDHEAGRDCFTQVANGYRND